uniref:CARDB domain-containing protein n=1 Tax=Candidatus Electronema sp. TaxID=2698783 RepID=UPI004057537F
MLSKQNYEIKGPGTGGAWQQVADDGSDADQLYPGAAQWEEITDEHGAHIPNVAGTYTARACADYHGSVPESDENNNCSEMTFEVQPVPAGSPTITVTNPTHDDEWRSDERKHIEWTSENFSSQERVKIEYSLDGGKTWDLVDDTAVNDGGKYWDMCEFHTEDTDDAFIRVTSLKYPYVYDDSDEFTIDHAKECK